MNILEQIDAYPDDIDHICCCQKYEPNGIEVGLIETKNLKQLAADHRAALARLADAEKVIDHYADKQSWNDEDENMYRRYGKGNFSAAEYRKKYPEVKE